MLQPADRLHPPPDPPLLPDAMVARGTTGCQSNRQFRVVEIHPAARLGAVTPGARRIKCLPRSLIERVIVDAAAQSYNAVVISGGELLLGAGLAAALAVAKRSGLATALATTLVPLTRRRLDRLAGVLDAVVIALYGAPQAHDRVRGEPGAFRAMAARLAALRAAGIPFGFVFTLNDANLGELAWVRRFALDEGARWLQIHPLEWGSAALFGEREPAGECSATRRDLPCRRSIRSLYSRRGHAACADYPPARLADLVDPLVVEADGAAVPLLHGFPRRYSLGNLRCARLPVLAARWRSSGGYARFRNDSEEILGRARSQPAFDWFAAVGDRLAPPVTRSVDRTAAWTR